MHFWFANEGMEVRLGDKVLGAQKSERDLGVIMQSDLKVNKQCSKAANEANKRLGMINKNFKCKAKKVILPLYKSIVRPHLDYCVRKGKAWRKGMHRTVVLGGILLGVRPVQVRKPDIPCVFGVTDIKRI